MNAKTLITAAVLACSLGASPIAYAADQKAADDQKAIEDYRAAARAFLAEFDGPHDPDDLALQARGLIRTCDVLPAAQLPHAALKYCADFEEFWQHEWRWKQQLKQQTRDLLPCPFLPTPPRPPCLCEVPHKMTRDGCNE